MLKEMSEEERKKLISTDLEMQTTHFYLVDPSNEDILKLPLPAAVIKGLKVPKPLRADIPPSWHVAREGDDIDIFLSLETKDGETLYIRIPRNTNALRFFSYALQSYSFGLMADNLDMSANGEYFETSALVMRIDVTGSMLVILDEFVVILSELAKAGKLECEKCDCEKCEKGRAEEMKKSFLDGYPEWDGKDIPEA